jgi:hypothetical protein
MLTDNRSEAEQQAPAQEPEAVTPTTEPEIVPAPRPPPADVRNFWVCCKCNHENNPVMGGDPPRCGDCGHNKCEDDCKPLK